MSKCGFIFLLFLGISTYYASNVDAASLPEEEDMDLCSAYKLLLEYCVNKTADMVYCVTGEGAANCLETARASLGSFCKPDPDITTARAIIEQKCQEFKTCMIYNIELLNCTLEPVSADYCSTGKDSCLGKAFETPPTNCIDTNITLVNEIIYRCQDLNETCHKYFKDVKEDCAPETADANYCKEDVEESCYRKLKFLNKTCPDKDPGDEGFKIAKKCDEPETNLEHCRNYLTAMFDCWNDEKLFPASCSLDQERYKLLNCVNKAREQHEDKCNSDVTKQYNSNMVIFLNATDKFLCQGNTPKFDADCLDSTVPKDIIVSSFAGDMNGCLPLLETIELFKANLGKGKCKILLGKYIVEIKKLDYCQPKRVTSEPCEKDGHGKIQLNILIGHDIHDNHIGMA